MNAVKHFVTNPKQVRKATTALVACVAIGVAKGVLPHAVDVWLSVAQPLLVAYGVWRVPNDQAPAQEA